MQVPIPFTRDLVLVGGGHAHALLLKKWGMNPLPGVRVTLIDPTPATAYTGMLPGFVAGHYSREDLDIDLLRLSRFAGARLVLGAVEGLDARNKTIHVSGHGPIEYDVASLNVGVGSRPAALPGFDVHGISVRPLGRFAETWTDWVHDTGGKGNIAVLGAGLGGVELALAMAHRAPDAKITLVDPGQAMTGVSTASRKSLHRHLNTAGIDLVQEMPERAMAEGLTLSNGAFLPADLIVASAGARPHDWVAQTGLATKNGFVEVDSTLRSTSHEDHFAVGDCASLIDIALPKAGVYAVRQSPILYNNLRAALGHGRTKPYRPQKSFLRLVALGPKTSRADRGPFSLESTWIWRWKDRIDRRFMDRLANLPSMESDRPSGPVAHGVLDMMDGPPPCGGCGAKVGSGALSAGIEDLKPTTREDIRLLPGDDAAAILSGDQTIVVSTDHLRGFSLDPALMARITAHHALGDIFAMGAEPQAALSTIILPPMSPELQARTLREISTAAESVFSEAGAAIIGGHTTQGSELTIGFTVTGLAGQRVISLQGAKAGDAIILTKPIGSGTMLAAEMAQSAKGRDVAKTWKDMEQSQARASEILAASGARAMTDVTGFGLLGHLKNICDASGVDADVLLGEIRFLHGAIGCASAGVRSSLYQANLDGLGKQVDGFMDDDPRCVLLCDPQTAGGLLASLPEDACAKTLAELNDAGYQAVRIGTFAAANPTGVARITLRDGAPV